MFYLTAVVSPFFAFEQSDLFGRFIVVLLVFISILAWTIVVDKWIYLRMVRRSADEFFEGILELGSPIEIFLNLDRFNGPLKSIASTGLKTLTGILKITDEKLVSDLKRVGFNHSLTDAEFELLGSSLEDAVDKEVLKMEENLGVLGSIVSSSPFLGLLGTVWGVMMAFSAMALRGKADINAIAPGVSGALLTTVVALLVAIPALVGYNHLTNSVRVHSIKFDNFAKEFLHSLKSRYLSIPGDKKK